MSTDLLAERPLTYEEERGKPMPSRNHAVVQMRLGIELAKHKEFFPLPELTLELVPDKWLVPDISVYKHTPVDFRHDVVRASEPPLLTVEILSPSQGLEEVLDKVEFYLANGVQSVWLVIPALHSATIFLPDGSRQVHQNGLVRDPAIGLTVDLDAVFS